MRRATIILAALALFTSPVWADNAPAKTAAPAAASASATASQKQAPAAAAAPAEKAATQASEASQAAAEAAVAAPTSDFKTLEEKISYIIGLNAGENLRHKGVTVNADILLRGLRDGLAGNKPALSEADMQQAMSMFQTQMMHQQMAKTKVEAAMNKEEGEAFLAANKTKEGVKTLPSGLQYKVLRAGTGPSPKATDTVRANYQGSFIDGTVFDSSYKRGQPVELRVDEVIKGWTEALEHMKVGGKWKIFVPAKLAYGEEGAGGVIGPNKTLVFEIELLGIKPAKTDTTPAPK